MNGSALRRNVSSIYYRALVSLTIVAAVSLVMVFAFFYPRMLQAAHSRIYEQRENSMQQTVQAMDRLFSQTIMISTVIEKEPALRPYALSSDDTVAIVNASKIISQLGSTQMNISAMFYHIIGSEWVISNYGTVSMSSFGRDAWRFGSLSQSALHDMLESPSSYQLAILPRTYSCYSAVSSRQDVLPFVISISSFGKSYASLLILFNSSYISSELGRSWQDDAIFISDGQRILFSTDSSLTSGLEVQGLSSRISGQALGDGSALYLSPSALYGFSYGVVCRSDSLQAELRSARNAALIFVAGAVLAIFLLTAAVSWWNYQPVRQFCADVGVDLSAKRSDSALLRARFEELMQTNHDLARSLQASHKVLEDAILQRFLVSMPGERELWLERGMSASCGWSAA